MQKVHVITFLIIIAIFGSIFWLLQKDGLQKSNLFFDKTATISLPPDALTPIVNKQNNQQQQQAQQQTDVQGPIKEDMRASISATIKTSKGTITVTLYNQEAHNAVKNFIEKAQKNFYNNLTFHRVEDWVIQGGDPQGTGTGGGAIVTELTGKSFVTGSLGWAASQNMQKGQDKRISNDSQFFIVKSDASWLDSEYTNFGIVTSGMGVVDKMQIGDKILSITISDK